MNKIQDALISPDTVLIGRLSGNETRLTGLILKGKTLDSSLIHNLLFVAGLFFKNKDSIERYVDLYLKAILNSKLLGIWDGCMKSQAIDFYDILDKQHANIKQIKAQSIEPYYFMYNDEYRFNEIIKEKKILIISSHVETMKLQLKHLDKLFPKKIFQNNEFIFFKPPMTHAGNHNHTDWENNFNKFKDDIISLNNDFDLALVSCGGYGMIISNFIKEKCNRDTIYVGGALQLWFGIKGKRWDLNPKVSKFYNQYWVRSIPSEIPVGNKFVEDSCYW